MTLDEVAFLQPGAVVPELQHRRVDVGDGCWRCERCQRLDGRRYLHALEVCSTAAMEVVKARDEARHERDELRLTLAALSPVLTAAAQIMGVQAIDPSTEEEGAQFAEKLWDRVKRERPTRTAPAAVKP